VLVGCDHAIPRNRFTSGGGRARPATGENERERGG